MTEQTLEAISQPDNLRTALDTGVALATPQEVGPGDVRTFVAVVPDGYRIADTAVDAEEFAERPRRKRGTTTARNAAAFISLVSKHQLAETEIYADLDKATITAVINAGEESDDITDPGEAGWADHRIVLSLRHTPEWLDFVKRDGVIGTQVEFAEFIEQHLPEFIDPTGAHMLELAQSFQANRSAKFESSKRLNSGETQLEYREEVNATAGRSGEIAIPDLFAVALIPFEGADTFRVHARLRYRLDGGSLRIGYVLERPHAVIREAFAGITDLVSQGLDREVLNGSR